MEEKVIAALLEDGFNIGEFIPDGKIKRFALDDDDKKKSGWYVGYTNYLLDTGEMYFFVCYSSWRDTELRKFCSLGRKLPPSQARAHKEQVDKARKAATAALEEEQLLVADEEHVKFWRLPHFGISSYIGRKQIIGVDLGVAYDGDVIYVPCRDIDGKIWSLEKIYPDGRKIGSTGGKKKGTFHVLGEMGSTIYFAEGFATAASIHLATGEACVCTFGSGGIKSIPKLFKDKYPDRHFVICGDADKDGKKSAEEAAKSILSSLVFPSFSKALTEGETAPSDFNDLHCREGIDAVKAQVPIGTTALVPVGLFGKDIALTPFPDEDDNGSRRGTFENVKELLRRLAIIVRYNGISKQEEIIIPDLSTTTDNKANVTLGSITSWCERCHVPVRNLGAYLTMMADSNLYNPVAAWIESEKWDGKSRLADFCATLVAPEAKLKDRLIRYWLLSAIAAAYEPGGVSAHGILVLQGAQYIGKTKWFKELAPAELIADGMLLRPDDKDSVFQVISKWLVELGELDATFKKSDISQLKAFITKDRDTIRRPYAKLESNYARRTVFFASVNEPTFLNDPTGNRRFWTIPCDAIAYDHGINMQQLWAEVLEQYRLGEKWYLTASEMHQLNDSNERFQTVEPIEEMIASMFDWKDSRRMELTATEVCLQLELRSPSSKDIRVASKVLKQLTGGEPKKNDKRKVFAVPPKIARQELLSIRPPAGAPAE